MLLKDWRNAQSLAKTLVTSGYFYKIELYFPFNYIATPSTQSKKE